MRGLMNSWAPISGFVCPSAARRAICASCGVRTSRVSSVSRRTVSPVAEQLAPGALGEGLGAEVGEALVRGAQLLAGVDALTGPPQPFAVEQVGAGELDADPGAAEPLDRLAVAARRRRRLADQRVRAGEHAERPVRAGGAGALLEPVAAPRAASSGCPARVAASTSSTSDQPT